MHADRLEDLRKDVASGAPTAQSRPRVVRDSWRALEEFNLNPSLALEALFVRVAREVRALPAWS